MWRNALGNLEGHNKGSKLMFSPSSITLFLAAPAIPVSDAQSRCRGRTENNADRLVLHREYSMGFSGFKQQVSLHHPQQQAGLPRGERQSGGSAGREDIGQR